MFRSKDVSFYKGYLEKPFVSQIVVSPALFLSIDPTRAVDAPTVSMMNKTNQNNENDFRLIIKPPVKFKENIVKVRLIRVQFIRIDYIMLLFNFLMFPKAYRDVTFNLVSTKFQIDIENLIK